MPEDPRRAEVPHQREFERLLCARGSIDVGDLLRGRGVAVIEAGELADIHEPFLLGLLATACFYYRKFSGPSEASELIVEEARQIASDVAKSQVAGMLNITEGIFDRSRQSWRAATSTW